MIFVHNFLEVYEIDGRETLLESESDAVLKVRSHPMGKNKMVIIEVGGHDYAVGADDLLVAIENATNVRQC